MIILPSRGRFLRNRLAYPAGFAPGFDPTHIAARGISKGGGFSGIASGRNFISLLSGATGAITGTPSKTVKNALGPAVTYTASTDVSSFTGQSVAADSNATWAGIVSFNTISVDQTIIATGSNGSTTVTGLLIGATTGVIEAALGATSTASGLPALVVNIPYFVAISVLGGVNVNFLIGNLKTGQIVTAAVATAGSPETSQGTYSVGNVAATGAVPALGNIAAVMYSPQYMSLQAMRAWAADPWSFWYPQRIQNRVGVSSGGVTTGVGEADGVGGVSAISSATSNQAGSVSGVGSASAIGAATSKQTSEADGLGAVSATSSATSKQVAEADGLGTASALSKDTAAEVGNADGTASVTAVSSATSKQSGEADGVGAVAAVSSATSKQVGEADGAGAVSAISSATSKQVADADGVGMASATYIAGNVANADGVGAVSAVSAATSKQVANAAGIGSALGADNALWSEVANADGIGSVSAVSAAASAQIADADGVGAASAISAAAAAGSGVANADGVASVSAISAATSAQVGEADGAGDAEGVGASVGGQKRVGWFRNWHDPEELDRRLAAQKGIHRVIEDALAELAQNKTKAARKTTKAIVYALESVEAAIVASEESKEQLTALLTGAIRAKTFGETIKQATEARKLAIAIIEAANDDDDEEALMLLAA